MKEIIYIQAGSLANFTGTHFWNTQESYFIYGSEEDGNADDPIVSNDISFREGLTYKVQSSQESINNASEILMKLAHFIRMSQSFVLGFLSLIGKVGLRYALGTRRS